MTKFKPDMSYETAAMSQGHARIAGVDEAGRGPLAGPVVAAAVILNPLALPVGLADSKTLSAKRRETLEKDIRELALVGVGIASVEEIDRLNILRASHLAMCRALDALPDAAETQSLPRSLRRQLSQNVPATASWWIWRNSILDTVGKRTRPTRQRLTCKRFEILV